ncbi:class I SAM-dependent methyltransferase [Oligoflexia bacterium]|nr:class I SAM-dependent methyltransferase [Oligoflexia bacterium]
MPTFEDQKSGQDFYINLEDEVSQGSDFRNAMGILRIEQLSDLLSGRDLMAAPLVEQRGETSMLNTDGEMVRTILHEHLAARETGEVKSLSRLDIFPFFSDYKEGPIPVNFGQLSKIFPGIERPDAALLGRLKDRDTRLKNETYGTMPAMETALLLSIVKAVQPRTILEIGTHKGILTTELARATGDTTVVFTLDLPPSRWDEARHPNDAVNHEYVKHGDDEVGEVFRSDPDIAHRVIQLTGDSAQVDFLPFADAVDLVVVDGSHMYANCRGDLINAYRMVSEGGVVVADDYGKLFRIAGVTRALCELFAQQGHEYCWANFQGDYETGLAILPNGPVAKLEKFASE